MPATMWLVPAGYWPLRLAALMLSPAGCWTMHLVAPLWPVPAD